MAQRDITGAPSPFGAAAGVWRVDYPDGVVNIIPGLTGTPDPNAALNTPAGITIDIHYNLAAFFANPDHSVKINVADLMGGEGDYAFNGFNGPVHVIFHNDLGLAINPSGAGKAFTIAVQAPRDNYGLDTTYYLFGPSAHEDYVHFENVSATQFPNHTVTAELVRHNSGTGDIPSFGRPLAANTIHLGGVIPTGATETWGNFTLHQRDQSRNDDFTITFRPGATAFDQAALDNLAARFDFSKSPPSVSVTGGSAPEGNANPGGQVPFKITLSKAAPVPVTVHWATSDGTAVAGQDYLGGSGDITFAADQTEQTINVSALGDTTVEPDETVILTLSNPSGGVTLDKATATGTIVNDDDPAKPSIFVNDTRVTEGGVLSFEVLLSVATTVPVTVSYATSDGTATGSDYTAANGTLSFAAGETRKTVVIQTTQDTLFEQDETLNFTLSNPVGGTVSRATAVGTIVNDDPAPTTGGGTGGGGTGGGAGGGTGGGAVGGADKFIVGGSPMDGTPYSGPVSYLQLQFLGTAAGEVVVGTAKNDFINLLGGDDAADGGAGDDVIDGGLGSNFLTGGAGRDVFFLDGRNGGVTWGTITDWQAGEELSLWGWKPGVSKAQWVDRAGATGYQGVTMHADLDGNGTIDASVTWSNKTRADLPTPTEHADLLWFHP